MGAEAKTTPMKEANLFNYSMEKSDNKGHSTTKAGTFALFTR